MRAPAAALVAALAAVATVCRAQNADGAAAAPDETVRVSVTIPVSIPLEVPAGQSFREAAAQFVARNALDAAAAEQLENALAARWSDMRRESAIRDECASMQLSYGVAPGTSWGTLPGNMRTRWRELDCDERVPAAPPAPLVTVDVRVGDTVLVLRAFAEDTVSSAVERFCAAHGVDLDANREALEAAVIERVRQREQALRERQQQQQQQQQQKVEADASERPFLFSIPFDVDGTLVRLRVHEGDELEALVRVFCDAQGLSEEQFGGVVRQAILDTSAAVSRRAQETLEQQQEQQREQQQAGKVGEASVEEPQLLLDIPILVDGAEQRMKLYDGDLVNEKIGDFCRAHGLREDEHGPLLLGHIKQRTEALRNSAA